MATLEVHNGEGRVERFVLTREQPLMFGTSPRADIVLGGAGVLPFHGRVRWQSKKGRFKVDASPEAEYLLVNGHKMASASFRQGDEVQVGACRIFMINEGDLPVAPVAAVRDDATRVQPPAFLAPPAAGTVISRKGERQARERVRAAALGFEEIPEALPDATAAGSSPSPATKGKARARAAVGSVPRRGWGGFLRKFSRRANRPGEEELLSSPLVFGLVVTFLTLVVVGVGLFSIIQRTAANRLYDRALENLEDGDYRNAIRRFDDFLAANPKDPRAGPARVHRAMANVRQYTASAGPSWALALEAEGAMLDGVGGEAAFRDSSGELEELVVKTGEGLADRAKATADETALAEAEAAVALHRRVAGGAAEALLNRSRLPTKLQAARAAVVKARARSEAFAAMDRALKGGSSAAVYDARDVLVGRYSDQAGDRDLLLRMNRANELIRAAVTVDTSGRPAETEPRAEPLGPPTTLVLRGPGAGAAAPGGPLVYALADGLAYALDGATGAPVWQTAVGLSSPFPPQPVPGGTTVLAVDARHRELLRLDARTGRLVWRQGLDESVTDPPLVLGNQVFQPSPGGKLMVLDLPTGAVRATVNLGRPLSRTPVADELGRSLYLAAESDCLFVLTRDPLACAAVDYLGHAAGAVGCAPARVGRYLIVPENHEPAESRWRVFVIDEDGVKLTPVQQIPIQGWTWGTPASSGSVVWAAGDRGGAAAYAVGAYGEKNPFRPIARMSPDSQPSGPAFTLARTEREVWVGSGRSARYELDPEKGKIEASWTLGAAGPAVAPPQASGKLLVLSQQNTEGPGVALWGVDPVTGSVEWRTVLGAPWPSTPSASPGGDRLVALGADGRTMGLTRDALKAGGFVTGVVPRPGGFHVPPAALARVEGEGWTAVVPALGSTTVLVRASDGAAFKEVGLPCPVGARPLALGRGLFVPGGDGRAYLVDPLSGEPLAEPFVPPFEKARPSRWRSPARVGPAAVALADTAGRLRRIDLVNDPRPRLAVAAETALGGDLAADPVAAESAVVVVTAENRVRSLVARDLSASGTWDLGAPLAAPPAVAGGMAFVADAAGNVLALGADGQRRWSSKLKGKGDAIALLGRPAVRDGAVWLLARDGTLHVFALADGSPLTTVSLGIFPAGGPLALGDDLAVPTGLGTLNLLTLGAGGTAPPAP